MNMQFSRSNMKHLPMTLDELRARAPSVFAEGAHGSRSERYAYIPSSRVVTGLAEAGFVPVNASEARAKDDSRRGFVKHMVRFRHPDAEAKQVGDVVPEIILRNAHDGTSAYLLMAGLFRLACLNGMIVAEGNIASVRVAHTGKTEQVVEKVVDGARLVIEGSVRALEAPKQWGQIDLAPAEREAFAESAHSLRFGDAEGDASDTSIKPAQLLVPRRSSDAKRDLWTTFNVVQENALRGGLAGTRRDANNRVRHTTTRAINGIDQNVSLNRALWALAEKMAELKAA